MKNENDASTLEEIDKQLKYWFSQAFNLIPKDHPILRSGCYCGFDIHALNTPKGEIGWYLSNTNNFSLSKESFPSLLKSLENVNYAKLNQIAKLEAELKELKKNL